MHDACWIKGKSDASAYVGGVDPAITTLGSPLMHREFRLYILRDEDYAEANEILLRLGAAEDPVHLPDGKWIAIALCIIGALIGMFLFR